MPLSHFRNGHTPPPEDPTPPVLRDAALDPASRLEVVLEQEHRLREEWQEAQRVADDIDPADQPDELGLARRAIRDAYRRWYEVSGQAASLAEEVRKRSLEMPSASEWDQLHTETLEDLKGTFDGGPHYLLLCERVAGLHVRLKRMEASGRDVPASEHAQLNAQLLGYINQLQKYTEAMKSESISREAQSVAEAILQLVEKHCATTYPELYLEIVKDVRSTLEAVA